jgi:chaperone BCS1
MLETFTSNLYAAAQSDFFAGGIALGGMGAAVAVLHRVWAVLIRLAWRRICVTVTLDNRSSAFRHFCVWLDQTGVLAHARRVRVTDLGRDRETELFAPAPGRHWFFHEGRICLLDREISDKTQVGAHYEKRPMETLTVTVLFGRLATMRKWVAEGERLTRTQARIGPAIHLLRDEYWQELGDVPRRAVDTVLSDDDRIERLLADVRWFYAARDWYATRGVPWRRGYLLFGPPGTGKSSAIRAIASAAEKDIAGLDIGRAGLTDDAIREAMVTAPREAMLVIEDIDAVFARREKGAGRVEITFSGLLNAIDGIAAQEGRALFMTTNHRERLDPALIRPGRADVHVELGPIGAATAARLYARFFPGEPELAERFCRALGDLKLPAAELQGWLLSQVSDPAAAASAEGLLPGTVLAAE